MHPWHDDMVSTGALDVTNGQAATVSIPVAGAAGAGAAGAGAAGAAVSNKTRKGQNILM
jgi:hypothetical protein